ncbi:MAG TPA: hypothetical protein VFL79_18145, partial [Terriglobia bacterium]|nr:hypothetical protein [Terriglobia bacterium]
MHHPSGTLGMTQGYIRIQIDFAHFRTQLELLHVLAGTFEINIGTALTSYVEFVFPGYPLRVPH